MNIGNKVNKIAAAMALMVGLSAGCANQRPVIIGRETENAYFEIEMQRLPDHNIGKPNYHIVAYEIPFIEMIERERSRGEGSHYDILRAMDRNNDGFISLKEQRRYFRDMYQK
ncbi:MAG: hypothetical protein ACMXYG_03745 [Candidatus Woesearchaeota archaeon]